jgi:predicted DsbA family dithiol-disulfide isomerase
MTTTKPELLIEVYTDPMCPWCWIGHARLEQTLQSKDFQDEIGKVMKPVVKLRPYILDTRLPATNFDPPDTVYDPIEATNWTKGSPPTKRQYYSKKFTNLDAFDAKISKAAKEVDVQGFVWLSEGKVGATWLAHRLLWYALQLEESSATATPDSASGDEYKPGLQDRLASLLYQSFHSQSLDLSNIQVLSRLATQVGLFTEEEEATKWLQSDQGDDELKQQVLIGQMNGVMSVPFLIVQVSAMHACWQLQRAKSE